MRFLRASFRPRQFSQAVLAELLEDDMSIPMKFTGSPGSFMCSVQHVIPIVSAFLDTRRVDHAERFLSDALSKPEFTYGLRGLMTAAVPNKFLEAYVRENNAVKVTEWYSKFSQLGIRPDAITFGFLIAMADECSDFPFTKEEILDMAEHHGVTQDGIRATGIAAWSPMPVPPDTTDNLESTPVVDHAKVIQALPSSKSSVSEFDQMDLPEINAVVRKINIKNSSRDFQMNNPSPEEQERSTLVEVPGVYYMRKSLRSLHSPGSAQPDLVSLEERLERDCQQVTKEKSDGLVQNLIKIRGLGNVNAVHQLFQYWVSQLTRVLDHKQNGSEQAKKSMLDDITDLLGKENVELLFTSALGNERLASIVLMNFFKVNLYSHELGGFYVTDLADAIADSLEREIFTVQISRKQFLSKTGLSYNEMTRALSSAQFLNPKVRQVYERLAHDQSALQDGWIPQWPKELKLRIGSNLLHVVVNNMILDPTSLNLCPSVQPLELLELSREQLPSAAEMAFKHTIVQNKDKSYGVIRINPTLYHNILSTNENPFLVACTHPMIIPPRLWLSYNTGGYLSHRSMVIRQGYDPRYLKSISPTLTRLYSGLDVLGKTAWVVNRRVLSIVAAAWNQGLDLNGVLPEPIFEDLELIVPKKEDFSKPTEYVAALNAFKNALNENRNRHSTRCDTFYKLEIARRFSGASETPLPFYFPHNVDFRGRAYPLPAHFNHLGNDLCRSLLLFATGKPLGPNGLHWLKVHAANLYGKSKLSFEDRVNWFDGQSSMLEKSLKDPLQDLYWTGADDPCQFLAVGYEIANALSLEDSSSYVCHFPVHMDGSCNGLQHYAALGRDALGGEKVNLAPSDCPSDIYQVVADLMNETLQKELEGKSMDQVIAGIQDESLDEKEAAAHFLRAFFAGRVTRKLIKQPVMTSVYGVTMKGAADQIFNQLNDVPILTEADVQPLQELYPKLSLSRVRYKASFFLAKYVFRSLGHIFDCSRKIQNWLAQVATQVTLSVPRSFAEKYGLNDTNAIEYDKSCRIVDPLRDSSGPKRKSKKSEKPKPNAKSCTGSEKLVASRATPTVEGSSESKADSEPNEKLQSAEAKSNKSRPDVYPMTAVQWRSPIGLEIMQNYRKDRTESMATPLQSILYRGLTREINKSEQVQGFPPNFIHSLDASHMFMTAIHFHDKDRPFAAVHDSYWALPSDIEVLGVSIRESFLDLHTQPILKDTLAYLEVKYKDYYLPVQKKIGTRKLLRGWAPLRLPPLPEQGTFDISQVLKSPYFFS